LTPASGRQDRMALPYATSIVRLFDIAAPIASRAQRP
jgi:hypothetical protein